MSEFTEVWLGSRLKLLGVSQWSRATKNSQIALATMLEF